MKMIRIAIMIGLFLLLSGCIKTMDVDLIVLNPSSNISACSSYIRYSKFHKLGDHAWIEVLAHGKERDLSAFPLFLDVHFLVHKDSTLELQDNRVVLLDRNLDKRDTLQMRSISYIGAASERCLACKKPFVPGFQMVGAIQNSKKLQTLGVKKYEARVFATNVVIPKGTEDSFLLKLADIKLDGQAVKVPLFSFDRKKYTLPNGECFSPW